jgi:hypothetical protein
VPNLVALVEVLEDSFIQEAVCVGEQTDSQLSSYREMGRRPTGGQKTPSDNAEQRGDGL